MKFCGAKVWIYLTGFDMDDLTWMRHNWMPLVYKLKHDFENHDFWGKDDFFLFLFFFNMDKAEPNAPSLEMDAWFLEILIFFFEKMMMMILKKKKKKFNEAWLNAPSLEIDVWFLEIFIIIIFLKRWWWWWYLKKNNNNNEWGMAECP